MTELSDAAIVRAVLNGEADAFKELVHRYQDQLYRHAERMTGQPDVAADIIQAAFVKAFRSLARCRNPERVGAWLFRIASNQCKDHLKSRRRKNLRLDDTRRLPAEEGDPEEAAERAQVRDRIRIALDRLTAEQREAFVLKHLAGLSYPEIAARLNESISALKMRVHRAREELQTLLEEYR
ncbi:MAG: RNA polymerase sigma factor [Gemmatimonadetes bacterium]|uniref:RNA polymerase sigma factor n=1 Tax=Candidatus Kutchimonas denitrificans TaxID=3056748 RepID=A0AAE4Z704_9BACT|nr:RNA polymerase sigma factor [Gemmatimonadota bacterium]NIR74930.1 RNA polymerase sigma factor [Candidatus Kutchimonas denitrificans]NIS00042.1 RNA polymerase sigma factor [Gemmatimonadota bacterium]NIT65625.1 RNA polymerase sigma factor [Gemmatimonadota bacterium]NIU52595.1 sigma-70 family RNA polymerase sigma factor [Gemmatimonadota bacterium]